MLQLGSGCSCRVSKPRLCCQRPWALALMAVPHLCLRLHLFRYALLPLPMHCACACA